MKTGWQTVVKLIGITAIAIGFITVAFFQDIVGLRAALGACVPAQNTTISCYALADTLSTKPITAIAITPDGLTLATSTSNQIQLWNVPTGMLTRSLPGHTDWITALATSADGLTLASASFDGTVKLWDITFGVLLHTLDTGRVTHLAFSPDGTLLATGSRTLKWADGTLSSVGVSLWNVSQASIINRLGSDMITALGFSPNSQLLAVASKQLQIWQVSSGALEKWIDLSQLDAPETAGSNRTVTNPAVVARPWLPSEVTALVFGLDNQTLFVGSNSKLSVWQANTGDLVQAVSSTASDLDLSPDGKVLMAANGGTVNLWQVGRRLKLVGSLRASWFSGLLTRFALEGQAIATASSDGVRLWRQSFAPVQPELPGLDL